MKGKDEIFKSRGIFCRAQWQNGQKVANSDVCAQPIANYRNLPGYTMRGGENRSLLRLALLVRRPELLVYARQAERFAAQPVV